MLAYVTLYISAVVRSLLCILNAVFNMMSDASVPAFSDHCLHLVPQWSLNAAGACQIGNA